MAPRNCWSKAAMRASRSLAWSPRHEPTRRAGGDVPADRLKRLGMKVDSAAMGGGRVGARRAMKTPPGQGGWQMFHTWHSGADCINPAVAIGVRASGDKAWFGW